MRTLYNIVVNGLLFFFIITLFDGVRLSGSPLLSKIIAAIVFGALVAAIPFILKFLKISDTVGGWLLLTLVLSFGFFFILYTGIGGIAVITGSRIDLGLNGAIIVLAGSLETLIGAALVSALGITGLYILGKK